MNKRVPPLPPPWRADAPSLLVREDASAKAVSSCKVAGFDLNDTLVTSRIGAPGYQVTVSDWQFYNAEVAGRLKKLHEDGFKIVIFTNQGNIRTALDGKRAQALRAYIDAFCVSVGVPIVVLSATQRDNFRKPENGMWEHFRTKCNSGKAGPCEIDKALSFYVGDAAGEAGDHSADDLNFAKQIGVRFVHVRDFFGAESGVGRGTSGSSASSMPQKRGGGVLGQLIAMEDPPAKKAKGLVPESEPLEETLDDVSRRRPVVLVLVGAPGCGKTTFAERLGPPAAKQGMRAAKASAGGGGGEEEHANWRRVCQDLLGNKEACIKSAEHYLDRGSSVVIDRTNVDEEQRRPWRDLAERKGARLHCMVFDVDADECSRRVASRKVHEGGLSGPRGRMVVLNLFSKLQAVSPSEGFRRICTVRTAADCDEQVAHYIGKSASSSTVAERESSAKQACATAMSSTVGTEVQAQPTRATSDAAPSSCAPRAPAQVTTQHPSATDKEADKVAALVALGFSSEASKKALAQASGDPNNAANALLSTFAASFVD